MMTSGLSKVIRFEKKLFLKQRSEQKVGFRSLNNVGFRSSLSARLRTPIKLVKSEMNKNADFSSSHHSEKN